MSIIISNGGYRSLLSYAYSTIIRLETVAFCNRIFTRDTDPQGRLSDQMVMAARSANANIAEASARGGTSMETEIKLTDVARGSLIELQCDLEAWLMLKNHIPWQFSSQEGINFKNVAIELPPAKYHDLYYEYATYIKKQQELYRPWFNDVDPAVSANALLLLCHRTIYLLSKQLEQNVQAFEANGGMRERMTKVRRDVLVSAPPAGRTPTCPECGQPMVLRNGKNGKFWSCSTFPVCQTTLPFYQ